VFIEGTGEPIGQGETTDPQARQQGQPHLPAPQTRRALSLVG
jgi:hypothetical protein